MNPDEQCNDEMYRQHQMKNLYDAIKDAIKLLSNPYGCHKQLVEELLGNLNQDTDQTPFPPYQMCSICRNNVNI